MMHIWWECPVLGDFWFAVHTTIRKITSTPVAFTPTQYLLHHSNIQRSQYHKSLAMIMVVAAARMCIPVHWKTPAAPTMKEWILRIQKIREM